jgi:hypothetical protein
MSVRDATGPEEMELLSRQSWEPGLLPHRKLRRSTSVSLPGAAEKKPVLLLQLNGVLLVALSALYISSATFVGAPARAAAYGTSQSIYCRLERYPSLELHPLSAFPELGDARLGYRLLGLCLCLELPLESVPILQLSQELIRWQSTKRLHQRCWQAQNCQFLTCSQGCWMD